MATRKDIKETFLSELEAASDGLVDAANVVLNDPSKAEEFPAVVYEEFSQPRPYGNASTIHATSETDWLGFPDEEVFHEYVGVRFDVYVLAETEMAKDGIYEQIRSYFNQYRMWKSPRAFHEDCKKFDLIDGSDADDVSAADDVRGDIITFELIYKRVQTHDAY